MGKKIWYIILMLLLIIALVCGAFCLSAWLFTLLWNYILPLFGVITINFYQGLGIILLLSIIGGFFRNNTNATSDLKENLRKLKDSLKETSAETETTTVPVEVTVKVEVDTPDDKESNVEATVNDVPMEKVAEEHTESEVKPKKPSRSRNRKKKNKEKEENTK